VFFGKEKGNQRAMPEMRQAMENIKKYNLHFYKEEIITPEASINFINTKHNNFNSPIRKLNLESFSKSKREDCFGFVCDGLVQVGISREELVLWGNAWSYEKNVLDAGASEIYSLYNFHLSNITKYDKYKIKKF